jgi:HEAT repeat protein
VADVQSEDEAKALLSALAKALESKDTGKAVDAVKPMVTKRHKSFVPELKKLLADRRYPVSSLAAEALGSQGDKTVASLLAKLVALEVRERGWILDYDVKAAAIESLGRLGVSAAYDAIRSLADEMLRDPGLKSKAAPPILRAVVRYFGLTKEKRAVSFLIDEVDQPEAGTITGTTPPADYWKARVEIWQRIRPDVVWALKEITGKEFETGRRWKNWFDAEGKKEGMK